MTDDTIAADEARRAAQYEAITSHVERDINADIQRRAGTGGADDSARLAKAAEDLRGAAINEVNRKDREVSVARGLARGSGLIDYVFALIYGLLAIRLVLAMVAARSGNAFVHLIQVITNPFYGMFRGIVPSPSVEGGFTLALPILIAMAVYALLHMAINGLLRTIAHRKTEL
ncbi:MAG: YggT family protein [Gemmatimonadales bacterium]